MTSVLVVDDQDLVRAGFVALLSATEGITVLGEAADGVAAVHAARELAPDVVLMDIRMPGLDGVGATERIVTAPRPPKVLVLTVFDLDEYVFTALRAGASGFVLKDSPPEMLIAGIRTVAGGGTLVAPSVLRRLVEAYALPAQPHPAAELDPLTARETEVLRLVGTGRSNAQIAAELRVSEATVKTHLNRSMAKLEISSRAQAVVVAYETGLVVPRRSGRRG